MKYYNNLIAAGTFDRFHKGHEAYLLYGLSHAKHVYITITSDKYTALYKPSVSPLSTRRASIEEFLTKQKADKKITITLIDDQYGIAIDKNLSLDAILVTKKTLPGAQAVNKKRKELGMKDLTIVMIPLTDTQHNQPISSSQIREGKIDRSGTLFIDPQWTTKTHMLPYNLRERFHKPFGLLVQTIPAVSMDKTVTVGDVTTKRFLENHKRPILSLVDFIVKRKEKFSSLEEIGFTGEEVVLPVKNPAGTITKEMWKSLQQGLDSIKEGKRVVIKVDGEEDLSVLPLILSLPLGFHIFYGQPAQGMVWIEVTESVKKETYDLLQKFL